MSPAETDTVTVTEQVTETTDARQQALSMSLLPGMYVVSCTTNPDTSTGDVLMSTMIRVVAS